MSGKEPDVIRATAIVVYLCATLSGAALAAPESPEPEPPPPIDWRDFVDDADMNADHVVGEELCAVPVAPESVPKSFVDIRQENTRAVKSGRKLS